jgi:hypothetical protein
MFKILDNGCDVLGGAVSLDNVYIAVYAQFDAKHARDLEVEEGAWATFRLSGEKGRYFVVRVQ